MRIQDVRQQLTTPLDAPAFPPGPYRFTDREYLTITYRTDPQTLDRLVPAPLEVGEPTVRFEVIRMPDTTGLGDYTEADQVLFVDYEGERGEYNLAMYVNGFPAIASGREIGAFPKKLGTPTLTVDSGTLVGTLDYGSLRVATATMGYKHSPVEANQAREEICAPTFMLKLLPGYDGRPRICELVRTQITDITVKGAWTGPARLQLFQHAMAPLADLPVLEILSARHVLTDLTLAPPEVVHNYLNR
ncbi:acetoacetate decarboxylase [Streptomyces sp. NPDC057963]|uniref:acetoacetate decarboxylase n=1 Tax=Streptomyces sp. NPDC057963 TaxID=3346290 RepID=UPI0036E08800